MKILVAGVATGIGLTLMTLVGCAPAAPPAQPTAVPTAVPPSPTPTPAAPEVKQTKHPTLGPILTDGAGKVLYLFTRDELNKSNCTGNCLSAWPPFFASGEVKVGEGAASQLVATIDAADGKKQVTYNGWPLYYYAQDSAAGDAKGQNVNNVWFVVHPPGGGPIQNGAQVKLAKGTNLGDVLVDASGRALYLYTKDEPGKSNCSGGCLRAWPALLTNGAPTAGEGANAGLFGTTTREDGTIQVTYNKWPLYYYAKDAKPGDLVGQNVGGVWFVLNAAGDGIGMPSASARP